MKNKEAFNTIIKSMFQQHKLDTESGYYTHDEATQRTIESYEGFYEWITEKKPLQQKNKKNTTQTKIITTIITIITIIGIIMIIGGMILK